MMLIKLGSVLQQHDDIIEVDWMPHGTCGHDIFHSRSNWISLPLKLR
jgi:hypothetical protein